MYGFLPVKRICSSKLLEIIVHAGNVSFTTTTHPPYNDTVKCGSITFRFGGKSSSGVRTVTFGGSTTKLSSIPVSFTTRRDVPFHLTRFVHCPISKETPTQIWTPLPFIWSITYTGGSRDSSNRSFSDECQRAKQTQDTSRNPATVLWFRHVTSTTADSTTSRKSSILAPDDH